MGSFLHSASQDSLANFETKVTLRIFRDLLAVSELQAQVAANLPFERQMMKPLALPGVAKGRTGETREKQQRHFA